MSLKEILTLDKIPDESIKDILLFPISSLRVPLLNNVTLNDFLITVFKQHYPEININNLYCFFIDNKKECIGKYFRLKDSFISLGIPLPNLITFLTESGQVDELALFNNDKHEDIGE